MEEKDQEVYLKFWGDFCEKTARILAYWKTAYAGFPTWRTSLISVSCASVAHVCLKSVGLAKPIHTTLISLQ
jgi:hypothetical protein